MGEYQKKATDYLNEIKTKTNKKILIDYAQELLDQFTTFDGHLDEAKITIGIAQKKDFPTLKKLIQYAYNIRYACNSNEHILSFDEVGDAPHIKTIVAKYRHQNRDIILATFRLVKEDIEIFKFFTFKDKRKEWPCKINGATPYELERMAFHPLFDFYPKRDLQLTLVKKMHAQALALIKDKNYWLVGTMRPGVKKFVEQAGIKNQEITWLKFADNKHTQYVRQNWPKYFNQDIRAYEIIT